MAIAGTQQDLEELAFHSMVPRLVASIDALHDAFARFITGMDARGAETKTLMEENTAANLRTAGATEQLEVSFRVLNLNVERLTHMAHMTQGLLTNAPPAAKAAPAQPPPPPWNWPPGYGRSGD